MPQINALITLRDLGISFAALLMDLQSRIRAVSERPRRLNAGKELRSILAWYEKALNSSSRQRRSH